MERLLKKGADIDAKQFDPDDNPLYIACKKGGDSLICWLLDQGADVDYQLPPPYDYLPIALRVNCTEGVAAIFEKQPNLDTPMGRASLLEAIEQGKEDIALQIIALGAPCLTYESDIYETSPLFQAVEGGMLELAKTLHAKGDDFHRTLFKSGRDIGLMAAAVCFADANVSTVPMRDGLDASVMIDYSRGKGPGSTAMLSYLHSVGVAIDGAGSTALAEAAKHCRLYDTRWLLAHGADPNRGGDHSMAVENAAMSNDVTLYVDLLRHGGFHRDMNRIASYSSTIALNLKHQHEKAAEDVAKLAHLLQAESSGSNKLAVAQAALFQAGERTGEEKPTLRLLRLTANEELGAVFQASLWGKDGAPRALALYHQIREALPETLQGKLQAVDPVWMELDSDPAPAPERKWSEAILPVSERNPITRVPR